jgi:hypothetical protein
MFKWALKLNKPEMGSVALGSFLGIVQGRITGGCLLFSFRRFIGYHGRRVSVACRGCSSCQNVVRYARGTTLIDTSNKYICKFLVLAGERFR